jgi:hypothetical protein
VADSMMGKWTIMKDECVGTPNTFGSQETFVIPVAGKEDAFIYVLDKWNKKDLKNSIQIFLPIQINGPKDISVKWYDHWDLRIYNSD